jgi:hypothetical protein
VAHLITSVIGAGVLSLSWSVAQLGWIAGPAAMIVFALVSLYTTFLLVDCYRFPDPVSGPMRNTSYRKTVRVNLGAISAHASTDSDFPSIFYLYGKWVLNITLVYLFSLYCFSGERKAWLCALVQNAFFYGVCVAYTITTSVSIRLVFITRTYMP